MPDKSLDRFIYTQKVSKWRNCLLFLCFLILFSCFGICASAGTRNRDTYEKNSSIVKNTEDQADQAANSDIKNVSRDEEQPEEKTTEAQPFCVYFIDVGQGDSSLIQCGDHFMLIDGGNRRRSDLIYSFLKH